MVGSGGFINLYGCDAALLQSDGHNWIISETTCDDIASGSTPEVFNPFDVVRDTAECSSLNQLRCDIFCYCASVRQTDSSVSIYILPFLFVSHKYV